MISSLFSWRVFEVLVIIWLAVSLIRKVKARLERIP